MSKKLKNAAAALNAANETKGGELKSELNNNETKGGELKSELNNTTAEQGTPAEQVEQGEQKGAKFTLNTPNPAFLNYLGTRDENFASEFEKFASEFDSSEFERPTTKKAGEAYDSLMSLLVSSEFLLNSENFSKYMSEKNPLADYAKPAIANALCYARAQLKLLCEFGNSAEKAYQNFNRAKEATKADLKAEIERLKAELAAKNA